MFYSQYILAKKGPLGTIWIAAHLERKLRKNQINDTNIIASVDSILFPEVPIALRLSGHLLLGVVRIYSRKVNYLLSDCSEALLKVKQTFQKSSVDLPPDAATAPFHSITLPEAFDFDDLEGYQLHENMGQTFADNCTDHHVTARDLITLQDQEGRRRFDAFFTLHDRFPEGGDPYSVLGSNNEIQHRSNRKILGVPVYQESAAAHILDEDVLPPLPIDDEMDLDIDKHNAIPTPNFGTDITNHGLFRLTTPMHAFDQEEGLELRPSFVLNGSSDQGPLTLQREQAIHASEGEQVQEHVPDIEKLRSTVNGMEQDQFSLGIAKDFDPSKEIPPETATGGKLENIAETNELKHQVLEDNDIFNEETPVPITLSPVNLRSFDHIPGGDDMLASILGVRETPVLRVMDTPSENQDMSQMKKGKRRRKAVYDGKPLLSSDLMKKQLLYVDDIRRVRKKAPCTEKDVQRLVREHYLEQTCVGPLLGGLCADLKSLYTRVVTEMHTLPAARCPGRVPFNRIPEIESGQAELHLDRNEILLEATKDTNDFATFADPVSPLVQDMEQPCQEISIVLETFDLPEIYEAHVSEAPMDDLVRNKTSMVNGKNDETVAGDQRPVLLEEFRNDVIQQECLAAEKSIKPSDIEILPMIESNLLGAPLRMEDEDQVLHVSSSGRDGMAPDVSQARVEDDVSHVGSKDTAFLAIDEDETFNESNADNQKSRKVSAENARWSTRTRAVARFLKTTFEKMNASCEPKGHQYARLNLNQLVVGRARKEAARMFFETLVLKSKDYVHLEQETGFADIFLFPTTLLKGLF